MHKVDAIRGTSREVQQTSLDQKYIIIFTVLQLKIDGQRVLMDFEALKSSHLKHFRDLSISNRIHLYS